MAGKKKLMILGTNEYQNPLILRAKELGYETHVFGCPRNEIGEKTADIYYPIDIFDYQALWEKCQEIKPCGVASVCSEVTIHPQNYLLRKLGIPCNSLETETVTTHKYLMRKAMKEGGVDSPNFMLVTKDMELSLIKNQLKGFAFPLIIKPCDLSSSRGVYKINSEDEIANGVEYAMSWSETGEAILEEFISGPEYSGESIAYNGEYKLLAITEKSTTGAPHFVETGHRQPANLTDEMVAKVEETLFRAFKALKIEWGAVHPEFRITPDGRILFMEIATRMGGDCIGTDLVPLSSGYDYLGMVIKTACGDLPDFEKIRVPMIAENKYIMTQDDREEFERIKLEEPQVIWRQSEMREISNSPVLKSADRAGYYITIREN